MTAVELVPINSGGENSVKCCVTKNKSGYKIGIQFLICIIDTDKLNLAQNRLRGQ